MQITSDLVKELREKTNAGVMDCKKALAEAKGDFNEAVKILKSKGAALAAKKAERVAANGMIFSYIHSGGKIGVLLELNCETDFVARNASFQALAKDIALQIAGAHPAPLYVKREDLSPEAVKKVDPEKLEKYYEEVCLFEQPFIKDSSIKIKQLIQGKIAEIGENILVRRFVRYQLGEAVSTGAY